LAALATMVLTENRFAALSASRFGKVGATITSKNTKTGEHLMRCVETIDLGQDKLVNVLVPPDKLNWQKSGKRRNRVSTFDGTAMLSGLQVLLLLA
jgi:hypothetical protein